MSDLAKPLTVHGFSVEPICPHSIQAFLDEGDSSTGVCDPGSSHHATLQSSAPGSQGCPTIGPQSRESFSKVWLPLCRGQGLLAPHIYSLKQNLTLLVSLWQTAQPPCPSPGALRDSGNRAIFHRERRECSADGGWAGDLGGVQGASHRLF